MSQTELHERTKIGKSSISTYLKGEYEAKQDRVDIIARALNVSPVWLMGYDVDIEPPKNETPKKAYYLDAETALLAQQIKDNPDYRILFDAGKNLKPEDVQFVKDMIDKLGRNNER